MGGRGLGRSRGRMARGSRPSLSFSRASSQTSLEIIKKVKRYAINSANAIGSSPRGFCVGVIVACGAAFLMPYGHPAPMLVQEPGAYSGGDYLRFGAGLSLLTLMVILAVVPLIWPL